MPWRARRTALLSLGLLLFCSLSYAWEYILNPTMTCSLFRMFDKAEFEAVTVDAQGFIVGCGPFTSDIPPAPLRVVKVSGSIGAQEWIYNVGGAQNARALSFCNSLRVGGPGDHGRFHCGA